MKPFIRASAAVISFSMPVSTAFAAPITAAPAISGRAANSRFTVSIASRKPLMIALPVTCTPATTTSQAAENHGAMASMAGFRTETSPSRITCQTAERGIAEADGDAGGLADLVPQPGERRRRCDHGGGGDRMRAGDAEHAGRRSASARRCTPPWPA